MNKLFTKIAGLALGAVMAVGVGVAIGSSRKEVSSVDAASDTLAMSALSSSDSNISAVAAKSTGQNAPITATVNSNAGVRMYANNTLTISSSQNITSLTIPWYKNGSKTFASVSVQSGGGTYTHASSSGNSGTWTGSSKEIVLKVGSSGQIQLYQIQYVTAAAKTLSSISLGGTYDTEFTVGDTFNHTGMTVTANYSDSTTATVTSSATWSNPDMSTSGTKQVTVSYTESSTTKTATYNINVNAAGTAYTVTNSVSNATLSSSASVAENDPLNITIIPGSHWVLPTSLTSVTMGGNTLTAGTGYTYNSSTGAFSIASVTGNVVITGACTAEPSYSVTYVAGDHGSGSNYVVSNQYAGSYTLATFATAGFTASSGYSFKKWSVGGVEYAEGASITISGATTVTAVYEEVTTYTIVTDASTLKDGTTFVLVGYISSTYYVSNGLNSGHVLLTSKTSATTISNGVESGSTLVSTEAQVLTLEGSTGAFKIKYGDSYLKFTGTSNGNDSFDTEANASTFSASMSGSYILFTCTSSTGSGRVWRMNTSSKDMRNYATSSGVSDVYMFANIPASNELDSVTTSGQTTSFTAGNKWSYGGTLTAHYTIDDDATVTPTSFKYGASGIDPTTAGTTISTSTTLDSSFNGKYVYVVYTEDEITKWASYSITINAAPATSVTLSSDEHRVALEEVFDVSTITATVNPSAYATQGVTWEVYDSDGLVEDSTYMFDGTEFYATEPADVVFHVKATATPSVYAEFTLTITGDPIAHILNGELVDVTDSSESFYGDVGTISYGVTTENFQGTLTYTWASSDTTVVSIDDDQGDMCDFYVEGKGGSTTLSCRVQGSVKGDVTVSVTVTITAVTVTSVSWTAPSINVYSGASLSSTSGWNVKYRTNSDPSTDKTADNFDVLLGGSVITLPHEWDAADDGKTLGVRVGGVSSSTTTVSVTQSLQAVMAPVPGESSTSTLTFTEKYSTGGATSDGGEEWTVASDAASGESNFDSTKGIHYGTGTSGTGNVTYITLTTSDFGTGNISQIIVNASTASGVTATVGVTVGGNQFGGDPQSLSSSATNYTFTGSAAADEIIVTITKPSNAAKALYCKSIAVTYAESSGTQNIANVAGHEAAQKAVVAFAKAMNAAFDDTENCTDGVAAAWATASSAYSSNIADNASLSADEKAYAKNLIKYASAQYTDDTDNDYSYCLERAMATYEACIQKHGQTPFMSDVRSVSASSRITSLSLLNNGNSNAVAIIVIISMISVTAIGGYFFLRKRKEI